MEYVWEAWKYTIKMIAKIEVGEVRTILNMLSS